MQAFHEVLTNILDDEQSGRPTVVNEELTQKVDEEIRQKRHFFTDFTTKKN